MRIESDLLQHLIACAQSKLANEKLVISSETALTIVVASGGYPETFSKGYEIEFSETNTIDSIIFHAGTKIDAGTVITSGGRVLAVTSLGNNIADAKAKSYNKIKSVQFTNMYFRTDIGNDVVNL
jgi:phosphoribosylamine--glycine ligase